MLRGLAAGLAVAGLLCGCTGGSEDDGTLDPAVLRQAVGRAAFQVRAPDLGKTSRLLNIGWTGEQRLQSINFDVVTGGGLPLSVEQAQDSTFGVIGAYTKGATALGSERIGGLRWDVYSQPSVGGVVYVHTYPDGVEVAVFGGAGRSSVRALAGSLESSL
jgi:Protein of unknown function (DUF4245)